MVTPLLEIMKTPLFRTLHTFSSQLHTIGCHPKCVQMRVHPILREEVLSPSWKYQLDQSVIPVWKFSSGSFFQISRMKLHDLIKKIHWNKLWISEYIKIFKNFLVNIMKMCGFNTWICLNKFMVEKNIYYT